MRASNRLGGVISILAALWAGPAFAQVQRIAPTVQSHIAAPARSAQHLSTEVIAIPAPAAIALPPSPLIVGAGASTLFDARLAIARAQAVDPYTAQTASFQYIQAVQQYRAGNFAAARISALQALATAMRSQVQSNNPSPLPTPPLVAAPAQVPGLAGGLYGADAPAIDADSFLALARGKLDDCAAHRDRRLSEAKQQYLKAEQDFAQHNWQATRIDARAAIAACTISQPG